MTATPEPSILMALAPIFTVAALYASVGHGGASGYLAVLSLLGFPQAETASTALALNILVAGTAFVTYARAGHFQFQRTLPFVLASIPAAFAGGFVHVGERTYALLLSGALLLAAFRLAFSVSSGSGHEAQTQPPPWEKALPIGGLIGFLSGVIGIGGGILLSPILLLMKWADTKQTAAISAFFIVVNAMAGLLGRFAQGSLAFGDLGPLVPAAFAGGLLGAHFGANRFSWLALRRVLALVLVTACVKLVGQAF